MHRLSPGTSNGHQSPPAVEQHHLVGTPPFRTPLITSTSPSSTPLVPLPADHCVSEKPQPCGSSSRSPSRLQSRRESGTQPSEIRIHVNETVDADIYLPSPAPPSYDEVVQDNYFQIPTGDCDIEVLNS